MNRLFLTRNAVQFAFSVALAFATTAHTVAAAESARVAEGRAHFTRGVEYFQDEDYRNAMVEFKRAYELAPNYKLLYNLGQTGLELKDYAFALKSLEEYLSKGENEIPAERRAEVANTVRKLRQRVAEVTVTTNVVDAEVLIDDQAVGRTPLSTALVLSAGHHVITATKDKLKTTRSFDVAGGERTELNLSLESDRTDGSAVPSSGEPSSKSHLATATRATKRLDNQPETAGAKSEPSSSNTPMWIGVAVTGALAVATGVTGGLAVSAKRDFDTTIQRYPITPNDVAAARSKTRNLALATDILGAATLVSCGVTVWLAVSGNQSGEDAKRIGVTFTPTGLLARGTF